jgi:transaldolase/glucose-6-phosphate isomerase
MLFPSGLAEPRKEQDMTKNPLLRVQELGQSVWLDFIRRGLIASGELKQLIDEDGLRGVTSNPAIFEKAIDGSTDYKAAVRSLSVQGKTTEEIFQVLAVEDVRQAADVFRPVFDRLDGRDGFVSLEVSPYLARDTERTVREARQLWAALNRPNVFIKVPATKEGLPAITQLISEGVNVNVTLLFSLERYREVALAYIAGLEARVAAGLSLDRIASVASFFLSRIDLMVDPLLERIVEDRCDRTKIAASCVGEVAIACAKIAYQIYKEIFSGDRFQKLAHSNARPQRVLWASTSTKNPLYSDVKYVEALIGPETINTLPMETLTAYRDHGNPASRLEGGLAEAKRILNLLPGLGIDLEVIARRLEHQGIQKFSQPFERLMRALDERRKEALSEPVDEQITQLGPYKSGMENRLSELENSGFSKRLWRKDSSLWKADVSRGQLAANSLGWLNVAEKMIPVVPQLEQFAAAAKKSGFSHIVHMGMGGSSLTPLVFQQSFSQTPNGISLSVLDTTDPAAILKIQREVSLPSTLFIVATKSGTTVEPLAFCDYFFDKVKSLKGDRAGDNFVAITDPGTPLASSALERGFRHTFLNFPDIGGRYSALSYFGMVPAAIMGLDVAELLERALRMKHACPSCNPLTQNPGLTLGAAIGQLALEGRDKLTILAPDALSALGMWLEQLLAESTGKEGRGVLPVAGEDLGDPSVYGGDRLFVSFRLENDAQQASEKTLGTLVAAGHPTITILLKDLLDLGQEFFRWEIATACAGFVLGINPFDQPNVQESKDYTNRVLKSVTDSGKLTDEKPAVTSDGLAFFSDKGTSDAKSLLAELFRNARPDDYVAIQAYLTESEDTEDLLQGMRTMLRDRLRLATTVGYGPRYLHSTGQYHKGGPNKGLFLQLTADDPIDVWIPGRPYTFGVLRKAQALGDLQALRAHGRRVIKIDLGENTRDGLTVLKEILDQALAML